MIAPLFFAMAATFGGIVGMLRFASILAVLAGLALPAQALDLTPNTGPMQFTGNLLDGGTVIGQFQVNGVLQQGNFTGDMTATVNGVAFSAPLKEGLSFLENGKCLLRGELERGRLELLGPCDDTSYGGPQGSFEGFLPGIGSVRGGMVGTITAAPPAKTKSASVLVPAGKLTCFWYELHLATSNDEINEYYTAYSMMVTLTLHPDGRYETASSGGSYALAGSKVTLRGGMFDGAVGTLEPDKSGDPAVVFYIDENRNAAGTPLVDPATTHCTLQG